MSEKEAVIQTDEVQNGPEEAIGEAEAKQKMALAELKESIVVEKGFDLRFPKEVEIAAEQVKKEKYPISAEELSKRRDIRDIPTFTIDPADAKDFDDALSFRTIGDNLYEVGIHIADVSYYVTDGSAIDAEARKRGTSIYLVDRTVPMLPPILSNDLCSLNPNEDKCSFSVIVEITGEGNVLKRWFGKTVMNSDKRFSYEEAQEVLEKGGIFESFPLLSPDFL